MLFSECFKVTAKSDSRCSRAYSISESTKGSNVAMRKVMQLKPFAYKLEVTEGAQSSLINLSSTY